MIAASSSKVMQQKKYGQRSRRALTVLAHEWDQAGREYNFVDLLVRAKQLNAPEWLMRALEVQVADRDSGIKEIGQAQVSSDAKALGEIAIRGFDSVEGDVAWIAYKELLRDKKKNDKYLPLMKAAAKPGNVFQSKDLATISELTSEIKAMMYWWEMPRAKPDWMLIQDFPSPQPQTQRS